MPVLAEPLTDLIEAAADILCMRGWLDPDEVEIPAEVIAQLAALASPCDSPGCSDPVTPDRLADHWITEQQKAWERSLPVWTCDCGTAFKTHASGMAYRAQQFYLAAADGLLGDPAGGVRRDRKGNVKHSDTCPNCGSPFAATQDQQANPQQALF